MSYVRRDVTTITASDHSGHSHLPRVSALPVDWYQPIMMVSSTTDSDSYVQFLNSNDFQSIFEAGVDDEIVISTVSPTSSAADNMLAQQDNAETESDNNDEQMYTENDVLLPDLGALTSAESNSNFLNTDGNESIQSWSPTSSFVLEEEVVPFSNNVDNVLLNLDLPTVYGNRRPSTDLDLLMLSRNILSPSGDSLNNLLLNTETPISALEGQDVTSTQNTTEREVESLVQSLNGAKDSSVTQINNPSFIQNIKTRTSVFHILLQGIVDKVELIREKTGASVTFYIIFGTLEFNEKNVHKYLKAREAKLSGPDGKYSRFNLLFHNRRKDGQSRRSPQPSTSANGYGMNGLENDHDYDLESTRKKSNSDSDSELIEDHLYAATLLRQKVSSPAVHDHQYNNDVPTACFISTRSDPLLSGTGPTRTGAIIDASPSNGSSSRSLKPRLTLTSKSHRHRCLRNLVEALFEKVKGLENKTGAKVLSVTISYEEMLITRQNFDDAFEQLLGVRRKTSFITRFGAEKSTEQEFLSSTQPTQRKELGSGVSGASAPANLQDINAVPAPLLTSFPIQFPSVIPNICPGGTVPWPPGSSVFLLPSHPHPVIEGALVSNDNESVRGQLAVPNLSSTLSAQTSHQTSQYSNFSANATHGAPICAKCSRAVPDSCRNPTEWTWLRCFNPLCFYMVHSTCLGFYFNGGSIDLRQFTFPPFYCEQHRLSHTSNIN